MQRIKQGFCEVRHVSDVENPSDFLTKRVSRDKLAASMAWAGAS